jgi:hypothetical protein
VRHDRNIGLQQQRVITWQWLRISRLWAGQSRKGLGETVPAGTSMRPGPEGRKVVAPTVRSGSGLPRDIRGPKDRH